MRPRTRAVSRIDSLCPICEPDGSRYVTPIPWSYAATSKAQRVRVEVFSKIKQRFFPVSLRCSVPAALARFSSAERSRRWRISSREKSDISRTLWFRRFAGIRRLRRLAPGPIGEERHGRRAAGRVVEEDPVPREPHVESRLLRHRVEPAARRDGRGEI